MVDQSELAFRCLVRRHGAQLCYTPMLHARRFLADATYRAQAFQSCGAADRPLVAQFAAHDPATLVAAARLLVGRVDAVDINCGCPENIAKKGRYGAFLLREPELVLSMVRALVADMEALRAEKRRAAALASSNGGGGGSGGGGGGGNGADDVDVPYVMVKIRLMETGHHVPEERRGLAGTLRFCRALEAAGAAALCVHGRTRLNKGPRTGAADWAAIAAVKAAVPALPVIANGNVATAADVARCLRETGCDAVMSAEALLGNPALFAGVGGGTAGCGDEREEEEAEEGAEEEKGGAEDADAGEVRRAGGAGAACACTRRRRQRQRSHPAAAAVERAPTPCELAAEYLALCELHPPADFLKVVKAHLFRLLHGLLAPPPAHAHAQAQAEAQAAVAPGLQERLQGAGTLAACGAVVAEAAEVEREMLAQATAPPSAAAEGEGGGSVPPLGAAEAAAATSLLSSWYLRHRRGRRPPKAERKAAVRDWLAAGTRIS